MTGLDRDTSKSPDRTGVCCTGRCAPSQCETITGPSFSSLNKPDQERTPAYRDSSGSESPSGCLLCYFFRRLGGAIWPALCSHRGASTLPAQPVSLPPLERCRGSRDEPGRGALAARRHCVPSDRRDQRRRKMTLRRRGSRKDGGSPGWSGHAKSVASSFGSGPEQNGAARPESQAPHAQRGQRRAIPGRSSMPIGNQVLDRRSLKRRHQQPSSAQWARALITIVRCTDQPARARCTHQNRCCSALFTAAKRIVGRVTGDSQIASASAACILDTVDAGRT